MKYIITLFGLLTIMMTATLVVPSPTLAQDFKGLHNPVIGNLGGNTAESKTDAETGTLFLRQFVNLWHNAINIGAILLIVYYLWGGVEWITAGGDSGKIEKARNRIMQATIGMIILAFSFIIIGFISYAIFGENFDLLNLQFLSPN